MLFCTGFTPKKHWPRPMKIPKLPRIALKTKQKSKNKTKNQQKTKTTNNNNKPKQSIKRRKLIGHGQWFCMGIQKQNIKTKQNKTKQNKTKNQETKNQKLAVQKLNISHNKSSDIFVYMSNGCRVILSIVLTLKEEHTTGYLSPTFSQP
jgi:outer membrane biosynthesis protein TonB